MTMFFFVAIFDFSGDYLLADISEYLSDPQAQLQMQNHSKYLFLIDPIIKLSQNWLTPSKQPETDALAVWSENIRSGSEILVSIGASVVSPK